MSRYSLVVVCVFANLYASSVCGEELRTFISKCEDAGLKAKIQKTFEKRCSVEVSAKSELDAIPPSGDIEIDIVLKERAVDGMAIAQVSKDRRIVSFEFISCQLARTAIEAIRVVAPNSIAFTKSELVDRTSERKRTDDSRFSGTFEITINDCNPLLADCLLSGLGFAKRTSIDMPSSYRVTLSAENKEIEQLVIKGCTLSVDLDFVETSNVSEVSVTNSKLSANDISRLLRLKRLNVLSIYKYEIDASEWALFDLPPKCADGLVVLTSGRLLDYFRDHLDSNVDLPGRKRVVK